MLDVNKDPLLHGGGGGEVIQVEFWNLSRYFWPGL